MLELGGVVCRFVWAVPFSAPMDMPVLAATGGAGMVRVLISMAIHSGHDRGRDVAGDDDLASVDLAHRQRVKLRHLLRVRRRPAAAAHG